MTYPCPRNSYPRCPPRLKRFSCFQDRIEFRRAGRSITGITLNARGVCFSCARRGVLMFPEVGRAGTRLCFAGAARRAFRSSSRVSSGRAVRVLRACDFSTIENEKEEDACYTSIRRRFAAAGYFEYTAQITAGNAAFRFRLEGKKNVISDDGAHHRPGHLRTTTKRNGTARA